MALKPYVDKNKKKRKNFRLYQSVPDLGIEGKKNCFERFKLYGIDRRVKDKSVLDIGSNMGMLSIECVRGGAKEVLGIEIEPCYYEGSKLLKEYYSLKNIKFQNISFAVFEKKNKRKFDVVLSLAVHRWVKQFDGIKLEPYLELLRNLIEPDGWLIFESHRKDNHRSIEVSLSRSSFMIREVIKSDSSKRWVVHCQS